LGKLGSGALGNLGDAELSKLSLALVKKLKELLLALLTELEGLNTTSLQGPYTMSITTYTRSSLQVLDSAVPYDAHETTTINARCRTVLQYEADID
jgi:hypothetical protein